jgi:hypothetical protein
MRMVLLLSGLLGICIVTLYSSCSKDDKEEKVCKGLITNTEGTNDPARIYMPEIFSPDGNGLNDVLKPIAIYIKSIDYTVYDSDFDVVYSSTDLAGGYVPDNPQSIYYYRIQAATDSGNQIGICGKVYSIENCIPKDLLDENLVFADQIDPYQGIVLPTAETPCTE